jgi:MFS family permease
MNFLSLQSNLWKYLVSQFTNRRHFIPILSVYYLTLPDTHANEIWLYTGIGFTAAMLMQIPAGFIADYWWQKNALIIAKILILFSTIFYLIADNFWVFVLASVLLSIGTSAFSSGINSSFLKWTLEKLDRGDEYREVASKISWRASLGSAVMIVCLPFLTEISILLPFYVMLILDCIWLIVAISFYPVHSKIEKHEKKNIVAVIQELRGTRFFVYAIFSSLIAGFLFTDSIYRSPYLVELWYPLAFIWFVMGGSRIVWWIIWRSIKTIEKYMSFRIFIISEIFLFPLYYIWVSYIKNPWILWFIFVVMVWWFWWRNEVYTDALIEEIPDKKYRSTALSIKTQFENIIQVVASFAIAWVMWISYSLGFQILGIVLCISLSCIYIFFLRKNS